MKLELQSNTKNKTVTIQHNQILLPCQQDGQIGDQSFGPTHGLISAGARQSAAPVPFLIPKQSDARRNRHLPPFLERFGMDGRRPKNFNWLDHSKKILAKM